jgi:hypothetical protein
VNPYGHAIAAADEVEGQRVRGEHGARVKYSGLHGNLNLRLSLDAWRGYVLRYDEATRRYSDTYAPRVDAYVHVDLQASDKLGYGLWVDYTDKDVRADPPPAPPPAPPSGVCYEIPYVDDERGEPIPCTGSRLKTIGRLRFKVDRSLTLTAQAQHAWLDDAPHRIDKRRHDVSATLTAVWRPNPGLRVRGRVRYLSEDVFDRDYLEESLWAYGEMVMRMRAKDQLTVRGDLFWWLDDRTSTGRREPQPELRVLGSYQAKF